MKSAIAIALLTSSCLATPLYPRADSSSSSYNDQPLSVNDTQVLNFALSLEHLETNFYHKALSQFGKQDFINAGYPDFAYGRVVQLAEHEDAHVALLEATLGDKKVLPCTYNFPFTDVKSFLNLARIFEGVGTSAYIGASKLIQNKQYLEVASTIVTTEARHQTFLNGALEKEYPWSGSFDTPLEANQVFTLASGFIVSCPASNPPLPVKAYPALTVTGNVQPGFTAGLSFTSTAYSGGSGRKLYAAFLSGLKTTFVEVSGSANQFTVAIPDELQGTVYVILTTSNQVVTDSNTVAGPAAILLDFDDTVANF